MRRTDLTSRGGMHARGQRPSTSGCIRRLHELKKAWFWMLFVMKIGFELFFESFRERESMGSSRHVYWQYKTPKQSLSLRKVSAYLSFRQLVQTVSYHWPTNPRVRSKQVQILVPRPSSLPAQTLLVAELLEPETLTTACLSFYSLLECPLPACCT